MCEMMDDNVCSLIRAKLISSSMLVGVASGEVMSDPSTHTPESILDTHKYTLSQG